MCFAHLEASPANLNLKTLQHFLLKKHHRKVRIKYRIKLRDKRQLETKRRWRTSSLLTIVGRNRGEVRKDEKEVNICTTCQPWSLWTTGGWREEGWTPAPRWRCFAASHWERERRDRGESKENQSERDGGQVNYCVRQLQVREGKEGGPKRHT